MYCILVTGIPAAGKSTIAAYLAKRLALPMISKDNLKEILFDTVGFHSRQEKVGLGVAAMKLMYAMAEQLLRCGQPFLLENNFENNSRDGLFEILERYSATALTLTMTGDYRRIYERFIRRESSKERHPGHVVNDCYPISAADGKMRISDSPTYESFVRGIRERGMDTFVANGPQIIVDTTDFATVDREALVEQIVEMCRGL